jgi:hypoxanthine phosphoribosyltransferase
LGLAPGGAFIARYVAHHAGVSEVYYARSRNWSNLSLADNARKFLKYYAEKQIDVEVTLPLDCGSLAGKRILLVDDSTCTGTTMRALTDKLMAAGAMEVKQYALFCSKHHITDYYFQVLYTPLVWPWGWEAA